MIFKKIYYILITTLILIIFSFNSAIAKEFKCKCVKFLSVNSIANKSMTPSKKCFELEPRLLKKCLICQVQ